MRNRALHDVLRDYVEQAAWQLAAETSGGAEVPFDLVAESGGRTPLYCYRPRTEEFIRGHLGVLGRLPTYAVAVRALESLGGLEAYLAVRGERRRPTDPGERADAVLRALLQRVFADASAFEFEAARFERAYGELEASVFAVRSLAQVVAPVRGLALVSGEVAIGDGLSLMRADALPGAPPDAARLVRAGAGNDDALAVLTTETPPGGPAPITQARLRLRHLLTALRLFERGGFALGPAAWTRFDDGPWQLVALGTGARPHGAPLVVEHDAEDELRAFCSLVARRMPQGGPVAWALTRYELGCERLDPFEGLTDHLLALRALLEVDGPDSAAFAWRLAALCERPAGRAALAERVTDAVALERVAIVGGTPAPGSDRLADELAEHLRALLCDVICGRLDADLRSLADELLAEDGAPAAYVEPSVPAADVEPNAFAADVEPNVPAAGL